MKKIALCLPLLLLACTSLRSKTDERKPIDLPQTTCPPLVLETTGVYRWPGGIEGDYKGASTVIVPETVELVSGVLGNAQVQAAFLVDDRWVSCLYEYDMKNVRMKLAKPCDSTSVGAQLTSSRIQLLVLAPPASGAQPKNDVVVRATFVQAGDGCVRPDSGK